MIYNFVRELNEYQMRIVATGNKPNELYDGVKWSALMEIGEQLEALKIRQNQKELDRVDVKSRQINQRFEQVAAELVQKEVQKEIIKIANIEGDSRNESHDSTEAGTSWGQYDDTGEATEMLCMQAIAKICSDFRYELHKSLGSVGEFSNVEKHVNELIHRANFRFSDLQAGVRKAKQLLTKCQKLSEIAHQGVHELSGKVPKEEHDKIQTNLRKVGKKRQTLEGKMQNLYTLSKQTFTSEPNQLHRK